MTNPSRRRPLAALLVAFVVVLAGCAGATGGAPDGSGTSAGTNAGTTTGAGTTANAPAGNVSVHFIDVGQASSTLLVAPDGTTVLVDSGHFEDDGEYVLSYLKRHGIERIDALVTTHADADHVGGHAAVIEYYETEANGVGAVYDPGIAASTRTYEEYLDAVERYDVPLYETRTGDTIPFGDATIRVLAPPEAPLEGGERNENSVVLRVAFGNTSFLLTGDGEGAAERYLVTKYGSRLNATVLAAGHHGSSSSTGAELLDAVDPAAVVVSSAYDSEYGHPHVETLRRLAGRSIPTYWTATHGDVVFRSNGSAIAVLAQERATTDPLRLRRASPVPPGSAEPLVRVATIRGDRVSNAGDSPSAGANATALADGGLSPDLAVAELHADAAGDEYANLNDEYVVLRNGGDAALELGGWTLRDEAGHVYRFPDGFALAPGATVTVHTGDGANDADDLYWGLDAPVWNNDGDTARVRSANGTLVAEGASA